MLDLNQRPPPCKGDKGCCWGLQGVAKPAYLSRFLFCALLSVAGVCVLGGVRVVSTGVRLCGECRLCGSRSEKATALGSSVYGGNRIRSCAAPLLVHKSFPPLPHLTSTHITAQRCCALLNSQSLHIYPTLLRVVLLTAPIRARNGPLLRS